MAAGTRSVEAVQLTAGLDQGCRGIVLKAVTISARYHEMNKQQYNDND
jgi:hypothetical protein